MGATCGAPEVVPGFCCGVHVAQSVSFVLSYYVSLRSVFRVVMSVTISTKKGCSVLFVPPVGCRELISYLRHVCVCLRIMLFNIFCVAFLFCFSSSCVPYVGSFSRLSIVDCLFGIFCCL